jgi:hypothetical protein
LGNELFSRCFLTNDWGKKLPNAGKKINQSQQKGETTKYLFFASQDERWRSNFFPGGKKINSTGKKLLQRKSSVGEYRYLDVGNQG